MEKLKKIILQMDQTKFEKFEESLIKNNSEKHITLLNYYRSDDSGNLLQMLNCNENALYVLKSRLFDKVQKFLLDSCNHEMDSIATNSTNHLSHYLKEYPRDTAIAMLHEVEKQYLQKNDSENLIRIYSVLKKAYFHSDKYYIYSQLFNQQVAYSITHEKADDLLFNFNKNLANYYFSNSSDDLEIIMLLLNEAKNIYALNKSHKIELILNIILIQILLFTSIDLSDEEPIEDLMEKSENILNQYSNDKYMDQFNLILNFFRFEYYSKLKQFKKSLTYFDIINEKSQEWLLYGNYCLAFKFLFSKIEVLSRLDRKNELQNEEKTHYYDHFDFYTSVSLKFHNAIGKFYSGEIKEAIMILNKIIDEASFVNFAHMEFEIKLTLAYFYYKKKEFELLGNLLKNMHRKVNTPEYAKYNNVKTFIKLLTLMLSEKESIAHKNKKTVLLEQFNYYNFNERRVLQHLQHDLDEILN